MSTERIVEWRVVWTQEQLGGVAAGTFEGPATADEETARQRLAHYQGLQYVSEARLERRVVAAWEAVDEPSGPRPLTYKQAMRVAALKREYGEARVLRAGPVRDAACRFLGCHCGPRVCVVQAKTTVLSVAPDGVVTSRDGWDATHV